MTMMLVLMTSSACTNGGKYLVMMSSGLFDDVLLEGL